jgi:hypothetical protein
MSRFVLGVKIAELVRTAGFRTQRAECLRLNCFLEAADNINQGPRMATIYIFIYLQLLDLLTTLVGFKLGVREASPFIRMLMYAGPATGVLASKVLALGLGGLCIYYKKNHLIRWVTYWYSGLIVWNLMVLLASPNPIVR